MRGVDKKRLQLPCLEVFLILFMKKFFLYFLISSMVGFSFAASKASITAANELAKKNIIVDHSTNTTKYKLDAPIIRQESIGIIIKMNSLTDKSTNNYVCKNTFSDVSKKDGWVCSAVETAAIK